MIEVSSSPVFFLIFKPKKLFLSLPSQTTVVAGFLQPPISALCPSDEPLQQQGHYSVLLNPVTLPSALTLHVMALNSERK